MEKETVAYSGWSWGLTVIIILSSIGLSLFTMAYGSTAQAAVVIAVMGMLYVSALIYAPVSIEADKKALIVHRPLFKKSLPVSEIASIAPHQPTMAEKRIIGSGGFFGYWGRFSEPSVGHYFAYYGKASDCFMVTLTDGRRYLFGCSNKRRIIDAVKEASQDCIS